MRTLCRATPDLTGSQFSIPEWNNGEGNEAAIALARTPLVDHPVVVGLHAQQRQFFVGCLEECLSAKPGEGREGQTGVGVVGLERD
jgi:hypothetical protein